MREPNIVPLTEAKAHAVAMSVKSMMDSIEELAELRDNISTWDILELSLTHIYLGQFLATLESQSLAAQSSNQVRQ